VLLVEPDGVETATQAISSTSFGCTTDPARTDGWRPSAASLSTVVSCPVYLARANSWIGKKCSLQTCPRCYIIQLYEDPDWSICRGRESSERTQRVQLTTHVIPALCIFRWRYTSLVQSRRKIRANRTAQRASWDSPRPPRTGACCVGASEGQSERSHFVEVLGLRRRDDFDSTGWKGSGLRHGLEPAGPLCVLFARDLSVGMYQRGVPPSKNAERNDVGCQ